MKLLSKALVSALFAAGAVPEIAQDTATVLQSAPVVTSESGDDFVTWKHNLANEASTASVGERGLSALAKAALTPRFSNATALRACSPRPSPSFLSA